MSFLNPDLVHSDLVEVIQPVKVKTIFNTYVIDKQVKLSGFKEFKTNEKLQFLLFKFHNYFDGLIGLEMMKQLEMKLDFQKSILETKNACIPLIYKPNFMSKPYVVPGRSKIIAQLPVDIKSGSIHITPTKVQDHLLIPEGIYEANEWYSYIEVINFSEIPQKFVIEQPIRARPLNHEQYFEVHNFSINNDNNEVCNDTNITDLIRTDHLNVEERKVLLKLCNQFEDIFFKEGQNLTFTNQIKHEIKTKDNIPIYTKSYRYPQIHKEEVQRQIMQMMDQGIIRPSFSPWSSPIWIVPKKQDASGRQKWRLVVDYRKLNEKTIDDRYPLPNITEILDKLGKCLYFSTLDLASGFHQIEVRPEDIPKTAFTVEGGHYEYVRMPFGLKNAPSTFQRVMDNVLRDSIGKICMCYMDDIIIFSTSLQEHLENLATVFKKLRQANLKVQLDKSEFLHKEIAFLGHVVTPEGVKPNPDKIKAVKKFPLPKTQKQIKSFLGLLGYYRKFIKDFAKLTKPMTECLRKDKEIKLNSEYIECFETCKNVLCNDPILQYPDFSKPFNVTTDASNVAIGAVLSQGPIGSDKPICYASRTLTKSEQNYSTIEKELLSIVWATKYFRPYLFGRKFKIITDHKPLTWLFSLKEPNSKLVRWRLRLEEFDYEIVYKKGKQNTNADALSRIEININESSQAHSDEESSISTIHSAQENLNDAIPISERPINEFSRQLILEKTIRPGRPQASFEIIFKTKRRNTIKRSDLDNEQTIIDIIKNYVGPKRLTGVFTDDNTFKIIQSVYSKFFNGSGIKLIRCMAMLQDITEIDTQEKIIREYHEKSNHRGITETFEHLRRNYYSPDLKNNITRVINNCNICSVNKYERTKQPIKYEITETPGKPLEILHIDVYSVHKENFLTILDKFSKFASAYLLTNRNSINIIKALKHFFSHHGIPKKMINDHGTEFISTTFQDFVKLYDIEFHVTSAKNSTGNSPVERFHSTLTEIVRIIHSQNKEKPIGEIVDEALITYNNSIHSTTKLTPFELITGHYNRATPFPTNPHPLTAQDYLQQHKEEYDALAKLAYDRSLKLKQNVIEKLNQKRKEPPDFAPNEVVYEAENRRNKLAPKFTQHRVEKNNKVTIISNKRKVHKQKIKNKRKFAGSPNIPRNAE